LSFRCRKTQEYTLREGEPPNPPCAADWADRILTWRILINLDPAAMPPSALIDPFFWYVGIHDRDGEEIHRRDVSEQDLVGLLAGRVSPIVIERQFESTREPLTWTVWPYSRSRGWLERIDGKVGAS
jgi:hypothetical protein